LEPKGPLDRPPLADDRPDCAARYGLPRRCAYSRVSDLDWKPGTRNPIGRVHHSGKAGHASFDHLQRLTSKGIAIHAGDLPGYPASHGCIRLPNEFAKQLFGITQVGTPVMITNDAEIIEQKRKQNEFQRASEEYSEAMADQQAAANRALIEFNRAKAEHEKILKQHEAEMAKYRSEISRK